MDLAVFVAQLLDPLRVALMVAATLLAAGFWLRWTHLWVAMAAAALFVATGFGAVLGSAMGVVLIGIVTNMVIGAITICIRQLFSWRAASKRSSP